MSYSGNYGKRLLGSARMKQLVRIRERDNYHCFKCKTPVEKGEVDHIIALENGGSNDDTNMQLLCIPCHKKKTIIDLGYVEHTGWKDGRPTNPSHHWNTED